MWKRKSYGRADITTLTVFLCRLISRPKDSKGQNVGVDKGLGYSKQSNTPVYVVRAARQNRSAQKPTGVVDGVHSGNRNENCEKTTTDKKEAHNNELGNKTSGKSRYRPASRTDCQTGIVHHAIQEIETLFDGWWRHTTAAFERCFHSTEAAETRCTLYSVRHVVKISKGFKVRNRNRRYILYLVLKIPSSKVYTDVNW